MSRNKARRRRGAIAALIGLLASLITFLGMGSAFGTGGGNPPPPDTNQCTYEWTRSIPQEHTEWYYTKYVHTKTRTWVEGTPAVKEVWANFSPDKQQGPFEGPPTWPNDSRGTWHVHDKIPPGQAGPDGVYSTSDGQGRASWFFRQNGVAGTEGHWGDWTDYGPWERWSPDTHNSWEDFNVEAIGDPAYHASGTYKDGTQWYRQWQVRNTGETRTVQDDPIVQGPVRSASEPDRGEYPNVPWTKVPGSEECPVPPGGDLSYSTDCESVTVNAPTGVTPENAKVVIKLDGKKVAPGSYVLTPGWHTLKLYVNGVKVDYAKFEVKQCEVPREGTSSFGFTCDTFTANEPEGVKPEDSPFQYVLDGENVAVGETVNITPGESHTVELWVDEQLVDTDVFEAPLCAVIDAPASFDGCEPANGPTNDEIFLSDNPFGKWLVNGEATNLDEIVAEGTHYVVTFVPDNPDLVATGQQLEWSFDFTKVACPPTYSAAQIDTSSSCGKAEFTNNGPVSLMVTTPEGSFELAPGASKTVKTSRSKLSWEANAEAEGVVYYGEGTVKVKQKCGTTPTPNPPHDNPPTTVTDLPDTGHVTTAVSEALPVSGQASASPLVAVLVSLAVGLITFLGAFAAMTLFGLGLKPQPRHIA